MELQDVIAEYLQREGISQKQLADRAGVNQSTVSRALQRASLRRTAAHARLCAYMREHAAVPPDPLMDAVRETWDGSPEHAAALAKLVLASRELWPTLGKGTKP
jgi:transcriptional regulator with XRE-family HTH domain